MNKTLKIRLYPNNQQEEYLAKLFGCYRKVYNLALDYSVKQYEEDNSKSYTSLPELGKIFRNHFRNNNEYSYLKEHNTKIMNDSLNNLSVAYKNFFKQQSAFPKFKSRYDRQSVGLHKEAFSRNIFKNKNKIFISKKFGLISYKTSDKYKNILENSEIQRVNISKTKSGKYFASILIRGFDRNLVNRNLLNSNPINDIVGIDLGIKDFIVDSNNNKFENIKTIRNNAKKIARLQRRLSKKQKGSNNKNKCRIKLAKYHEKLNNKKENYLHQVANQLLNENQVIVMEDLNVSGMMKNHKLARSIQELSLFRFKTILKYKAEWYGRDIIEIDRWFPSSKQCSNCKHKNNDLTLKDREWVCSKCNTKHDRDLNAAINIRNEGQRIYNLLLSESNVKPSVGNNTDNLTNKILVRNEELKPLEIVLDNDLSLQ